MAKARTEPVAAEELGPLLLGLMTALKEHVHRRITEFGLTPSQADALRNLDESRSQRELARCLHFDASNVTDIADRLEERGLVERQVDPEDRRVRRLVLTSQGQAVRDALFNGLVDDAPFLRTLTSAEQRTLRDLLAKMVTPVDLPS